MPTHKLLFSLEMLPLKNKTLRFLYILGEELKKKKKRGQNNKERKKKI